jgi:hypothetical protein
VKDAILCILGLLLALPARSQKEGYNWVLGDFVSTDSLFQMAIMNFSHDPVSIEYVPKSVGIDFVSSSLSDSNGQLVCFSNGTNIFNKEFSIIENGNEIQPSQWYPWGLGSQSLIMLPFGQSKYILLSGKLVNYYAKNGSLIGGLSPFFYYHMRFDEPTPLGSIEIVKESINYDTVNYHGTTAVRHGNGRDWWVVSQKNESNKYSIIYLNDGHPEKHTLQSVGDSLPPGWDHAVFSPDGRWYARYSWWGKIGPNGVTYSDVYLYNFDRCSGVLSNFKSYRLKDNGPGGVAISPNSRYLYVSNWDTIFQYDLHAPDIFATETVVAGYDGFRGEDGWPVRFFTPQLAPDGRIYICVPNVSSRYLHYIEHPDSAGLACKVVQHGIKLPVYNSNTLPNLPYFRLYEEKGSPCDTIWKGKREDYTGILLHPNPGGASVNLHIPGDGLEREGQLNMYSTIGSLVLTMPLPAKTTDNPLNTNGLGIGLYFYEIAINGKRVFRGKWIKNKN